MARAAFSRGAQVIRFGQELTPREIEVLAAAAHGLQNGEIAARLHIGSETVQSHLKAVYVKLGAHQRAHAVAIGFRRGLLDVDDY